MPAFALCLFAAACSEPAAAPESEMPKAGRTAVAIVAQGESFACTPTRVWDGDGPIWCAEGPRIRLAGIAAREMDGTCRPSHPCPDASAEQAKAALVQLLGGATGTHRDGHALVSGPRLTCHSNGGARGNRTGARCSLPDGRDLSCAMLRTRTVLRWASFDREDRLSRCG